MERNVPHEEVLILNVAEPESFQGIPQNIQLPVQQQPQAGQQGPDEGEISVPKHLYSDLVEYPNADRNAGACGVVLKVFSPLIGTAAMKKSKNTWLSERELTNWEREVKSIFFLNYHPHIVTLYGYVYNNLNDRYPMGILMEFMSGGTLNDFILNQEATNEYSITPSVSNTWAKQIALGLAFIHHRNIMHRDLKPNNILLSQNRLTAKIADFGFARNVEPSVNFTVGVGNPMYAAPEVYLENGNYATSADVWSYGMILYFIYYHRHPYVFQTLTKIAPLIRVRVWRGDEQNDRMAMRPALNDCPVDAIIEECWKTAPDQRCNMMNVVNFFHSTAGVQIFPSVIG